MTLRKRKPGGSWNEVVREAEDAAWIAFPVSLNINATHKISKETNEQR